MILKLKNSNLNLVNVNIKAAKNSARVVSGSSILLPNHKTHIFFFFLLCLFVKACGLNTYEIESPDHLVT